MTENFSKISSIFFSPRLIWLTPNELVSYQLRRVLLQKARTRGQRSDFLNNPAPRLMSFSGLEGLLARELEEPEIDPLVRGFILEHLSGPLAEFLWPDLKSRQIDLKTRARLARDIGDGLDRLKLAGLPWEKVAGLPPRPLAEILADIGQKYEKALAERKRQDRAGLRKKILESLENGTSFNILNGVEKIICRWSQRLSPFETDLLLALAKGRQVELTLSLPGWVLDENIDHGAGFDLLRTVRQIERRTDLTSLSAIFEPSLEGPAAEGAPALAYAAEMLLAPPSRRKTPPPDPGQQIKIVSVPTAYHEVEEAARLIKAKLKQGLAPESLALVVPDLGTYGPLVDDLGRRFGLAFHFRRGETLADKGPAGAVLDLISLWNSNWEQPRIIDLLRSPYFRLNLPAVEARRLALAAGVTDCRAGGGFEENLEKICSNQPARKSGQAQAELARSLKALIERLKSGADQIRAAESWADFTVRLKRILNDLGWPGHIGQTPQSPVNARGLDLAAASAFKEELDKLVEALNDPAAPAPSLSFFRVQLEAALKERHLSFDPSPEGRVRVLNYYDLHGGLFDEIFFLGLNERVFPHTGPEIRWWPEEFVQAASKAEVLGRPIWSEAADRYRQQELMLAAGLGQALNTVWLFHHESDESGRAALPSPLLSALRDLWPDGSGGSLLVTEKRRFMVTPPLPLAAGEDEMWAALMKVPLNNWPEELKTEDHLTRRARLAARRECWLQMKGPARPGPAAVSRWLALRPGYRGQALISPAFLASYASCPLAFWFSQALGLSDDGRSLDEWGRDSEGTFLHGILEKFISRRLEPGGDSAKTAWPEGADYEKCRAELMEILAQEQAALVKSTPLGRRPLWSLRRESWPALLSGWLRREINESRAGLHPYRLEWTFGDQPENDAPPWELPLSGQEALFFRGRVDRIDQGPDGLCLRDYKLKENPGLKIKAGEKEPPPLSWPLLIYTLAAQKHFGQKVEAWFEILDSKEAKFRLPTPASDSPFMRNSGELKTSGGELGFPDLLSRSWQKLREGFFPAAEEAAGCAWCGLTLLCPHGDENDEGGEER